MPEFEVASRELAYDENSHTHHDLLAESTKSACTYDEVFELTGDGKACAKCPRLVATKTSRDLAATQPSSELAMRPQRSCLVVRTEREYIFLYMWLPFNLSSPGRWLAD